MACLLVSKRFAHDFAESLARLAEAYDPGMQILHLPDQPNAELAECDSARFDVAFLDRDIRFSHQYRAYCAAMMSGAALRWAHFPGTMIDHHKFVKTLIERRVTLTSSAGTNGEAVGHTAVASLLYLSRKFAHWQSAQRRHEWAPMSGDAVPKDLRGQTAMIVGLGTIGSTVARALIALGLHIIGIRRSPRRADDFIDEIHPPSALRALLPRCDWVVLACPHTPETHRLLDRESLACLPTGAGLINVARAAVTDEQAVVEALNSGRLGCAHLDVFDHEPLSKDSPLWDMPNVLVTPHNAGASSGSDRRAAELFVANLERWYRREKLVNEI